MENITKFQILTAKLDKALQEAQHHHKTCTETLSGLESAVVAQGTSAQALNLVDVSPFGYCADSSLRFKSGDGVAQTLLRLLPPEPLVSVLGASYSQKPVRAVRENEMRDTIVPLAPVLFKQGGTDQRLQWWSQLPNGLTTQVEVTGATLQELYELFPAPGYLPQSHPYATGSTSFARKALAKPATIQTVLARWWAAWGEFGEQQGYAGAQLAFLHRAQSLVLHEQWSDNALFEDFRVATEFPGEAGTAFKDFCEKQHQAFKGLWPARAEESKAIDSALKELAAMGTPSRVDPMLSEYITHYVQARTGLDVRVHVFNSPTYLHRMELEVRMVDAPEVIRPSFCVNTNSEAQLKLQDIPVTYAVA